MTYQATTHSSPWSVVSLRHPLPVAHSRQRQSITLLNQTNQRKEDGEANSLAQRASPDFCDGNMPPDRNQQGANVRTPNRSDLPNKQEGTKKLKGIDHTVDRPHKLDIADKTNFFSFFSANSNMQKFLRLFFYLFHYLLCEHAEDFFCLCDIFLGQFL